MVLKNLNMALFRQRSHHSNCLLRILCICMWIGFYLSFERPSGRTLSEKNLIKPCERRRFRCTWSHKMIKYHHWGFMAQKHIFLWHRTSKEHYIFTIFKIPVIYSQQKVIWTFSKHLEKRLFSILIQFSRLCKEVS